MPFSSMVNSSMLFVPLLLTPHGPDYSHVITATFKGDKELSPPTPQAAMYPTIIWILCQLGSSYKAEIP